MEGQSIESEKNSENPADLIKNSQDFDQLYESLKQIETIKGTQKTYTSNEVIELVESARKVNALINFIPRTYGIRDKVKELLGISETDPLV